MIKKILDCIMPLVLTFICMIIGTLAAVALISVYAGVSPDVQSVTQAVPATTLISTAAFYILTFIVMIRLVKVDTLRYGKFQNEWSIPKIVLSTAAAFVIAIALNYILYYSGVTRIFTTYQEAVEGSVVGQPLILIIIVNVILAPIVEEIVFRGLTYRRIREKLGVTAAIILTSLMFGLYHMNMVQFIYATLLGLLLAYYVEKSNSLVPCILAHMAANSFAVISFI